LRDLNITLTRIGVEKEFSVVLHVTACKEKKMVRKGREHKKELCTRPRERMGKTRGVKKYRVSIIEGAEKKTQTENASD